MSLDEIQISDSCNQMAAKTKYYTPKGGTRFLSLHRVLIAQRQQ